MLRVYQLLIQQFATALIILMLGEKCKAQEAKADSLVFQYKVSANGILDKGLVTRLILSSQNNFILRDQWTSFEPILNYRFGNIKPNGLNKTELENDFFILLKNHFLYLNRLFPSVLSGFENSPNIRRLDNRIYAGLGFGSNILKMKYSQLQLMLYGVYESSTFELIAYKAFRIMPFIKGNHYSHKAKVGLSYIINPFLSPWLDDNWRFRGNIRPYFKIKQRLDFSISYNLWYESLVSGTQPKEISVLMYGFTYANF